MREEKRAWKRHPANPIHMEQKFRRSPEAKKSFLVQIEEPVPRPSWELVGTTPSLSAQLCPPMSYHMSSYN